MTEQNTLQNSIIDLWEQLSAESGVPHMHAFRRYRRLNLNKENGIRVSCNFPDNIWELLIEAGKPGENVSIDFPNWQGMGFEILSLDVPKQATPHIRLFLESEQFKDIFSTVCTDLVLGLDSCISSDQRRLELSRFLDKWNLFFERHGYGELSQEQQRGLFGELWWINVLLGKGISERTVLASWKGCERGFHDFDLLGHVVEVKTTMTKEPRKVKISNERQLDDTGLKDLHLYVLTLTKSDDSGMSLPAIVHNLLENFSNFNKSEFQNLLQKSGYLDVHVGLYTSCYSIKHEELFHVTNGFPRMTTLPAGTGDLSYSVTISACNAFCKEVESYLSALQVELTDDKG